MRWIEKVLACVCVGMVCAHAAAPVLAQERPVRLLVFAAGGPVDYTARILASKLEPLLGVPVLVEARPGANGIVAAQAVATSEPDGNTLLFASSGLFMITPTLNKSTLPYDTDADFIPVSRVVINASAVVVSGSVPANTVAEFISYAKSSKAALAFASPGLGNITHLWIEQFKAATRLDIAVVPYKGIAPAIADIIEGRVTSAIADMPALLAHIKSGRMKVLGLVGRERNRAVPDIPTVYEQGFPGVEAVSWYAVFARAKTPAAVVSKLHDAIAKALSDPEAIAKLAAAGGSAAPSTSEELGRLVRSERARWAQTVSERLVTSQ